MGSSLPFLLTVSMVSEHRFSRISMNKYERLLQAILNFTHFAYIYHLIVADDNGRVSCTKVPYLCYSLLVYMLFLPTT